MKELNADTIEFLKQSASSKVLHYCEPLQELGIIYFKYAKNISQNKRIWLTNHFAWQKHFLEQEYFKISPFGRANRVYEPGEYLWKVLPSRQIYEDARENFGFSHGITLVDCADGKNEFWFFATEVGNTEIYNLYLNEIELLRFFTRNFKEQTTPLVETLMNYLTPDVVMPLRRQPLFYTDHHYDRTERFLQQLSNVGAKTHLEMNGKCIYLTKRQMLCLSLLMQGNSQATIAEMLGISPRTVESHIDSIKQKLDCSRLIQLGAIIGGNELFSQQLQVISDEFFKDVVMNQKKSN